MSSNNQGRRSNIAPIKSLQPRRQNSCAVSMRLSIGVRRTGGSRAVESQRF